MNGNRALEQATVLDAVVFRVDGQAFTRTDVLRWAERHDAEFARRVRRRLGLAAQADDDDPAESAIEKCAENFRYDRGLEDAGAMQQWLEQRAISVETWWEALRRSVLESTAVHSTDEALPETGLDALNAEDWRADLCATDLLDSAVRDLASRAAVATERGRAGRVSSTAGDASAAPEVSVPWDELGIGDERLAECDARLDALAAAWESWRSAIVTDAALKSVVDHHRLEWLVVDVVLSWWPGADAAREAIWCVKEDGQALEAVSRDAHQPAEPSVLLLEDAPPPLHDVLLAAAPGDVVGPVEVGTQWVVALVKNKRPPSLTEAPVRAAAERAVERNAATPLLDRHVAWPDSPP
ncbi:MAG: hypothetical protein ACHQQ3_08555 [Gemmatimonadales bacterium]